MAALHSSTIKQLLCWPRKVLSFISWDGEVCNCHILNWKKIPLTQNLLTFNRLNLFNISDSQMVAHLLGSPEVGAVPAESSHHSAEATSSYPSRSTTWNIFLHHHGMAKLATGEDKVGCSRETVYDASLVILVFTFISDSGPLWKPSSRSALATNHGQTIWNGPRSVHDRIRVGCCCCNITFHCWPRVFVSERFSFRNAELNFFTI